jgi:ubiquinone/menaquinone biosynthesis C-methylase UbiE/uncharacterized protein YbaR (Trm112 family)
MRKKDIFRGSIAALQTNVEILQALAFDRLMNQLWSADNLKSDIGIFLQNDLDCIDDLIKLLGDSPPKLQNMIAWLLGVLFEADSASDESERRLIIKAGIPKYLGIAENILKDKNSEGESKDIYGLMFLLGHFPEDAALIEERLSNYLGQDEYQATSLGLAFSLIENHPVRSKFLLAYQGAQACNLAYDARIPIFKNVLACPECHETLDYSKDLIHCQACHSNYQWQLNVPNLILNSCMDPEEYPESLVKIYETESRPRFVHAMGQDWMSLITRERERGYITQFLHPINGPILDLACGVGNSTQYLIDGFGSSRIIAVDYSHAMLQQFEQSIKGTTVVRGSSSALPIASNSLGGVNCSDALQALPDAQQAFLEITRCMRPGAVFTGFTFLEASWPYSYFQHRLHYAKRRLFTVDEIKDFLVNSHLEMVDFTVIEQVIFFTAKKPLN